MKSKIFKKLLWGTLVTLPLASATALSAGCIKKDEPKPVPEPTPQPKPVDEVEIDKKGDNNKKEESSSEIKKDEEKQEKTSTSTDETKKEDKKDEVKEEIKTDGEDKKQDEIKPTPEPTPQPEPKPVDEVKTNEKENSDSSKEDDKNKKSEETSEIKKDEEKQEKTSTSTDETKKEDKKEEVKEEIKTGEEAKNEETNNEVTLLEEYQNTPRMEMKVDSENKLAKIFTEKTIFVRPPFGMTFEFADKSLNLPNITTIFDHLDSPAVSKSNNEDSPSGAILEANTGTTTDKLEMQGVQEVSEFLALPSVMRYYLNIGNPEDLVIFGGDTNIMDVNFYLQRHSNFEGITPVLDSLYTSVVGDKFYTSLDTKGGYKNPYDKMFFINGSDSDFRVLTSNEDNANNFKFKVDIARGFYQQNQIWKRKEIEQVGEKTNENDTKYIRNKISDHAPVYTDIEINGKTINSNPSVLKEYPKNETNTIRVAHWNILKYNGKKPGKVLAIAQLIAQTGFDIIGLTEVTKSSGTEPQKIVDILNDLTGRHYTFGYQSRNDTDIPQEFLDSKRFGKNQQEVVAIIYDSTLFNSVGFKNLGNLTEVSYLKPIPLLKK
ncbi:hypothetical protein [Mycoplasma hafezii]|uniref:hypothetical protein n=1 Tax=Mycoplasma hafezii TaxID=525886 RepID=UPI003CE9DC4F